MIRIMNVFALAMVVLFSFGLYNVKYDARIAERGVSKLRQEIEIEKETLKVLRAEWSHLNQPERIQKLADKYLDLGPVGLAQIVDFQDVPTKPFTAQRARADRLTDDGELTPAERIAQEELASPPVGVAPQPKPFVLTRGGDANG